MKKVNDHPITEPNPKDLNPTERDFLDVIPERYRAGAFASYKDYRKLSMFGSVFERSKMCMAFMNGFVTATHMVMKADESTKDIKDEIVL